MGPPPSAGTAFYWPPAHPADQSGARKTEATCSTPLPHAFLSVKRVKAGREGGDNQSKGRGKMKAFLIG